MAVGSQQHDEWETGETKTWTTWKESRILQERRKASGSTHSSSHVVPHMKRSSAEGKTSSEKSFLIKVLVLLLCTSWNLPKNRSMDLLNPAHNTLKKNKTIPKIKGSMMVISLESVLLFNRQRRWFPLTWREKHWTWRFTHHQNIPSKATCQFKEHIRRWFHKLLQQGS